jgi:glycosyltransferase involved in cell wall biosynthesis
VHVPERDTDVTSPDGDAGVTSPTDADTARRAKGETRTTIVLPVYNEAANVEALLEELRDVIESDVMAAYRPVEVLMVDDGSTDGTRNRLRHLATEYPCLEVVLLRRNFGQSAAMAAGIDHARGEYVVTMDADGQNNPADVPRLLAKLEDGYDCVSGWRRDRDDPLRKTIPSTVQTRLARWTGADIHDFGCTLKAYRAVGLYDIDLYGEGHRYIPAKLHKRGYEITELPVDHRPRTAGETKYGPQRLLKGFVDLLFHAFWNRYSARPSHFLGGVGLLFAGVGTLIGGHAVALKYAFGASLAPHTPRLLLSVGLVLFGFQLLMFGFLAEMIVKQQYHYDRPYRIQTTIGEDT